MITDIFKRLSPKSTAADLRASLATIDVAALEAAVASAQKERAALLLAGTNDQILKAEQTVDACRIDLDRARAMREELERRIVDADIREAGAAYRAKLAAAQAGCEAVSRLLTGKVAAAARTIDEAVAEVARAEAFSAEVIREKLRRVGTGDEIDNAEFPQSPAEWINGPENCLPAWCAALMVEASRESGYRGT